MLLLVVPGSGDVEAAAKRLVDARMPAYEARQALLRGVPFTIPADVERARGAAIELRALGVEAWAVDEDAIAAAPRVTVVRSFRLFAEGIEVSTRPTAKEPAATHAIRWGAVELVLPARSIASTSTERVTTKARITVNPMKMMRGTSKKSVEHQREVDEERFLLVLARDDAGAFVLARFDQHGTEFTGLADKKQATARGNFDAFVAVLKASATGARVDDRLDKNASKLAGVPVGVAHGAQQAGIVRRVDVSATEDNEGAVVAAARWLCLAERLRRG